MIKFEHTEVVGWEAAIRGMRNPMNSWDKSDSLFCPKDQSVKCEKCKNYEYCGSNYRKFDGMFLEKNDLDLMKRLRDAGTDHRKFMRMIVVYVDITAPLYWWKEFDTYKVGTVANSCSTMHKIADKEFTLEDFSTEHLFGAEEYEKIACLANNFPKFKESYGEEIYWTPIEILNCTIMGLNFYRKRYLDTKDKKFWRQIIQLLPTSYNQNRTIMMNYEVLANIYTSRKNHKLDEWCEHDGISNPLGKVTKKTETEKGLTLEGFKYFGFCDWIKTLPYSELITGDTSRGLRSNIRIVDDAIGSEDIL